MTCLLCGKKLAIFRKSSIGDFCSLEHRALYLAEKSELRSQAGTDGTGSAAQVTVAGRDPDSTVRVGAGSGRTPQLRGYFEPMQTAARPRMSAEPPRETRDATPSPLLAGGMKVSAAAVGGAGTPLVDHGPMSFEIKALLDAHFPRVLPLETHAPARAAEAPEQMVAVAEPEMQPEMQPERAFALEIASTLPVEVTPADVAPQLRQDLPGFRFAAALAMPKPDYRPLAPEAEVPASPASAFDLPTAKVETARRVTPMIRPPVLPIEEFAYPPADALRHTAQLRLPSPAAIEPEFPLTPLHIEVSAGQSRYDRDEYYEFFENLPAQALKRNQQAQEWKKYIPNLQLLASAACLFVMIGSVVAFLSIPRAGGSDSRVSSGVADLFSGKLDGLRSLLRSRAAIRYDTDFRSGLSNWSGPAGWSKDWSYDQAGFLRPGKFGLWRQSMPLSDYRMEFLGQIERKSIGWVFRATDEMNYNAAKITITKPGALPMADLVHYAVVNGQAGPHTSVHLPFAVRNDSLYRVQMDVQGTQFTTRVNGRLVDSWSDSSHRAGGVGFLSDAGELARVRWLRVSNRDDLIGRICSYLTAQAMLPSTEVLSAFSYEFPEEPEL